MGATTRRLRAVANPLLPAELSHDGVEFSVHRLDLWIERGQNGDIGFLHYVRS